MNLNIRIAYGGFDLDKSKADDVTKMNGVFHKFSDVCMYICRYQNKNKFL